MRRRQFITLLGGAAATWPLPLSAQQPAKIPRIGIIDDAPMWNAFRQGLRDLGYLEGQNIAFDYRYADGVPVRLVEAAAALVRRPVDVITTYGTPPTRAAQQATTTIPIVMIGSAIRWAPGSWRASPGPEATSLEHHPWPGRRWQTAAAPQGGHSLRLARGLSVESG